LGFLDPITAAIVSFCFLGIMLYKRVNLGITLNATAIVMALLALSWQEIPTLIYITSVSLLTIAVVLATFGIMWLSQLYKETGYINKLSESLGKIIKNPKIVSSVLPAVIGFLPVAGGALMSAPLVEAEGEKLKLKSEKRAYVNLWFRHTIFPVYPISQVLIVTAALAGTTVLAIILRQIPVVVVMVIVGYVIGFWKIPNPKREEDSKTSSGLNSNLKTFSITFAPILATIIVAIGIELTGLQLEGSELAKLGFDVLIATFFGIIVLVMLSKPSLKVFVKPLKSRGIYGVTLAAYGAFLLGSVIKAAGISNILGIFAASGSVDIIVLLTLIPAVLGVLTASALGGVSISIPLLGGIIALSPKTASLIYMSAYLGYVISPTHLCFAFTADYFKCPLNKAYKYVLPSFIVTFATTLLIYFLF
jgi:integral membrane protein (TIGR00529 family)